MLASAFACYVGLAILCARMIAADEHRLPPHRRTAPVIVVLVSVAWFPALIYCTVALGVDVLAARLRRR